MAPRKRIAAILSTYFPASHADVVVTKFLKGFPTDDGLLPPEVEIASIYLDQVSDRDIGTALAGEFGVPIYLSIPQALCLGGRELAVDGVLSIGEHGDYAYNEKGQKLYPRRHFFEQIAGVISTARRPVPVFSDKHLSYCWEDAKWICDRAHQLGIPLMAGSSIPLFWRDPWLEHEVDSPITEALVISYGEIEAYGYHGLEGLQCMVERRQGGETGVRAVHCLEGAAVWAALDGSLRELAEAAVARVDCQEGATGSLEELIEEPALFLVEYADGLRGALLQPNSYGGKIHGWSYAARVAGKVQSTGFHAHGDPYPHFSYLALNAQSMFLSGVPRYPAERTLLVSGVLDAVMDSRYRGHLRLETPHLSVSYRPASQPPIRPLGPRPVNASTVPMHQVAV
ncbi:MAG: hypothetical protein WDA75_18230 [Candidatus Latescibacterota bacterium]|jgi:hypothetical protein